MDEYTDLSKREIILMIQAQFTEERDSFEEKCSVLREYYASKVAIAEVKMQKNLMLFRTTLRKHYTSDFRRLDSELAEQNNMKKCALRVLIEHMFADMASANDRPSRKKWCIGDFQDCECPRCTKLKQRKRPIPTLGATITHLMIEDTK